MKNLFLFVFSIFLNVANSQTQTRIEKSGNYVNKDNTPYYTSMIGSDSTSFYTLRIDKNFFGFYTGKYSVDQISKTNANYVKRIAEVSSVAATMSDQIPTTIMVKDKIYVFTKFYNKTNKTYDFILDEIIINSTGKTPNRSVLISYPIDDPKANQSTFFTLCISPDSSKMGVVASHINDVTFYLYDLSNFKEISKKKITSISSGERFKIDNNGNLFYIQKFSLYQLSANNNSVLKCNININKSYNVNDLDYVFDIKNNQIYVHSIFYEKNTNPKLNTYSNIGIFIVKIDKNTLAISNEKYHSFNSDILKSITCGKLENGFPYYSNYVSNIILTKNSEILFEAEQKLKENNNRGTNVGSAYDMSTKVSFDAYEIIVTKLNSNLELTWMKLIPRQNNYTNITNKTESTIVYTRMFANEKLKYYFIEHPKFELKKMDYLTISSCETPLIRIYPETNVVEYSLDKNGNLGKRVVFNNKKEWLIPEFYDLNLGNDQYIVRFRDDNKEHFSIFSLK